MATSSHQLKNEQLPFPLELFWRQHMTCTPRCHDKQQTLRYGEQEELLSRTEQPRLRAKPTASKTVNRVHRMSLW